MRTAPWLVFALSLSAGAGAVAETVPAKGAPVDMKQVVVKLTLLAQQSASKLGVRTGKALCPSAVTAKPGKITRFQCTVPYEEELAPYVVTFDLTKNTFDISPDRAILSTKLLSNFVTANIVPPDPSAKADCGKGKVLVRPVGSTVVCSVKGSKRAGTVTVKVTSNQGGVTIIA